MFGMPRTIDPYDRVRERLDAIASGHPSELLPGDVVIEALEAGDNQWMRVDSARNRAEARLKVEWLLEDERYDDVRIRRPSTTTRSSRH